MRTQHRQWGAVHKTHFLYSFALKIVLMLSCDKQRPFIVNLLQCLAQILNETSVNGYKEITVCDPVNQSLEK